MPVDDRVTATIDAADESLSFGPTGPFRMHVSGTWVGTLSLQVSQDGTTYDTITTYSGNPDPAPLINAVSGIGTFRLYATAWTSGSATVVFASV